MKTGRLISGDLNGDGAREQRSPLERALDGVPEIPPLPQMPQPFPSPDPPLSALDSETDADAQLYAYLDRAKSPKSKGFPPLDALSARLNEFSPPLHYTEVFKDPAREAPAHQSQPSSPEPRRGGDLAWFEERFLELKGLLTRQEADKGEILSINAKLAEIIGRVDKLSAVMPGERTMAAVEIQLAELSRSLEVTREQSSTDASRIARAAKEILAATERAGEARAGFETAARHTVRELGQTVVVAASRAAAVTAEHIAAALHQSAESSSLGRVESELRALNVLSRESSERTTAALERVHETLRIFLERGSADRASAAAPKKRAGVHMPIAAGAPAYSRPDADFGSAPARKPQLDTITLRTPPPHDPNLIRALEEAGQRLTSRSSGSLKQEQEAAQTQRPSPPSFLAGPLFREEDKALPLFGLGIVAVVLLIASAALYYLHSKAELPPFHLSVLPDVQAARVSPEGSAPRNWRIEDDGPERLLTTEPKGGPALFTAADQNHASPSRLQPDSGEDLQMLTSAASRGDREAQFRIGARFLNDGTPQGDPATAARWLTRAADQGHTESQFILASLYERGAGVPKDENQARDLYRKAASAGHIRAMHNLGVLLSTQETPQDYQEAAGWFTTAATAGLTDSQFNLALLYERGLGVQQNSGKAYFWYQVASLAGDKEATRHAERLKHGLPEAETQAADEQAGAWRPTVEQLPRLAGASDARG